MIEFERLTSRRNRSAVLVEIEQLELMLDVDQFVFLDIREHLDDFIGTEVCMEQEYIGIIIISIVTVIVIVIVIVVFVVVVVVAVVVVVFVIVTVRNLLIGFINTNARIIIIIMNFYSPVSNTRCHSIGHKMRIARIKIRVDSPGRWERA